MKRINIEASSNLAHLLRQWHRDEDAYFERLQRALRMAAYATTACKTKLQFIGMAFSVIW